MSYKQDQTPTFQRVARQFPDIDMLGREMGYEIGFRQLDEGEPSVPATALVGKNVSLTHMQFSCRYHQLGMPPSGTLTVGVPIVGLSTWFGRRYRQSSILPFNHQGGFDGVSESAFEAMAVAVSVEYLEEVAKTYQIPVPEWLLRPSNDSIINRGQFNERFRNLISQALSSPVFSRQPDFEDEVIIALLKAAHDNSALRNRTSPRLRNRAVKQALAYIADHQDSVISVRDICKQNQIAVRTLNRAFNERFGIGPKAYLMRRRLSAVRSELLRCPPGTLVTDVANRWGFWHLGQFAKDYRTLFGELPSQTSRSPLVVERRFQ